MAKSFDGPIKLLFPRALATVDKKAEFSLLGLGDIVVPGFFIALLLRFDCVQAGISSLQAKTVEFSKPYFHTTLVSYAAGLLLTVAVMYFFNAAQPALLYLVPCCLLSSLAVGLVRNEFKVLFSYDEEAQINDAKMAKAEKESQESKTEGSKKTK